MKRIGDLCRVISELFNPDDFDLHNDRLTAAVKQMPSTSPTSKSR
jgi:hypothetical protein